SQESEKRFADANCFEGKMINISSMGMIFRCEAEENSLYIDQQITIRFRVPRFGSFEPFNMLLTTHTGHICRVCNMNNLWHQIAIKFDNPLFFRPGEQGLTEYEVLQKLKGIVIQDGVPYTVGA
ncbi:MAG: hypothetical protein KAS96_07440, partial [Planctomycetes bacterium]|nr:hypothetical protein [Planctomycetota bacterium]